MTCATAGAADPSEDRSTVGIAHPVSGIGESGVEMRPERWIEPHLQHRALYTSHPLISLA